MKYLKFKNLMSISMAAMMIFSSMGNSFAQEKFNDLTDARWAQEKIMKWNELGFVAGYEDSTFRPQANITRAEFATLVYNSYKLSSPSVKSFGDVKESDWYYSIVGQMAQLGLLSGYEDNTFRPEAYISRAEAAAILSQINKLTPNSQSAERFADYNNINDWAKGFVGAAVEKSYMAGYPDNTFKAQNFITRAEAVVTLDNSLDPQQTPVQPPVATMPQETITAPGTYGGTPVEYKFVTGTLEVKSKDVILENMVIEGDLILGKEIGEGDISLSNVTVKGNTYVYGGGVSSIYIINSFLKDLFVDKANDAVRVVAQGSSTFGTINAKSGVILEEKDLLNSAGFVSVVIEAGATGEILLNGEFDKVEVNAEGITLRLSDETVIQFSVINETINVVGQGSMLTAQLFTNMVNFEIRPANVLNRTTGELAIIINGEREYIRSTTGGGGGGGGGGVTAPPAESPALYDYRVKAFYYQSESLKASIIEEYDQNHDLNFSLLGAFYNDNKDLFVNKLAGSDGFITKLLNLQSDSGSVYAQVIAQDIMNSPESFTIINKDDEHQAELLYWIANGVGESADIEEFAEIIAENDLQVIEQDIISLYGNKTIADINMSGLTFKSYSEDQKQMADIPSGTTIAQLSSVLFSRVDSSKLYDVSSLSGQAVLEISLGDNVLNIEVQKIKKK